MGRLIRLDHSGHTTLAQWDSAEEAEVDAARVAFESELERGMIASMSHSDGSAEVVRELSPDAELVVLRRPIAGG